jgi:hypothetical protein
MRMKSPFLLSVLLAAVLTMSACSAEMEDEVEMPETVRGMALAEAKELTQETTLEVAKVIPQPLVASVVQNPKGSILTSRDGTHHWAGHLEITFNGPIDAVPHFETAVDDWRGRAGWSAERDEMFDGSPQLVITGPGGSVYLMSMALDRRSAHISTMSPSADIKPGEVQGPNY